MRKDETKKIKWARSLLLIFIVAAFPFVMVYLAFSSLPSAKNQNILVVKKVSVEIEVARTQLEKEKGLCCRDYLPKDSGMLFVYDKPGNYRFWMRDTRIPLDMYWINSQKKIIHIEKNVQPESYPKSFGPAASSQYILETNAGFASAHSIVVGDSVSFKL